MVAESYDPNDKAILVLLFSTPYGDGKKTRISLPAYTHKNLRKQIKVNKKLSLFHMTENVSANNRNVGTFSSGCNKLCKFYFLALSLLERLNWTDRMENIRAFLCPFSKIEMNIFLKLNGLWLFHSQTNFKYSIKLKALLKYFRLIYGGQINLLNNDNV